jgi:AraC-binding-like domain
VSDQASRVFHWSASTVRPADRIGYWKEALSSAYAPLSMDSVDAEGFVSEFRGAPLGRIAVVSHTGSPHRCSRGQRELALSRDHSFALVLMLTGSWNVTHCGQYRLRPGDLWLHDSGYPIDLTVCTSYASANLQLSEGFLSEWLSNPAALVGRPISRKSKWGRSSARQSPRLEDGRASRIRLILREWLDSELAKRHCNGEDPGTREALLACFPPQLVPTRHRPGG